MTTVPTASRPGVFPFLDLPAELRNKIYNNLLTRDPTKLRGVHPQILATCRQIHNEASGLLYSLNRIDVYVHRDVIRWHGMSYPGSGAIHWLLPFGKSRQWHRPYFRFLRKAENLSIHIVHHQHPSWVQSPKHPLLSLYKEYNWIFQLHANLEWLVHRISKKNHQLKNLYINLQLSNGHYVHPEKILQTEQWLLSAFSKMRGVDRLIVGPVWDPERAFKMCVPMTLPRFEKKGMHLCP